MCAARGFLSRNDPEVVHGGLCQCWSLASVTLRAEAVTEEIFSVAAHKRGEFDGYVSVLKAMWSTMKFCRWRVDISRCRRIYTCVCTYILVDLTKFFLLI